MKRVLLIITVIAGCFTVLSAMEGLMLLAPFWVIVTLFLSILTIFEKR